LYNLGFTNENCQKRLKRLRRGQSYFSANLSASTGYELQLTLDNEFKFEELRERNLSHVHATFFSGRSPADQDEEQNNLQKNKDLFVDSNDVRFHVQSYQKPLPGSNLFKMCFPDNDPLNLPLELVNGKPRIKEDLDQETKRSILLVKESRNPILMKRGDVTASIITGTFYTGEGLKEEREYCDLSLYFNPDKLIQAIQDNTLMADVVKQYLQVSVEVSEAVTENIKSFNKKRRQESFSS